MGSLTAYIGPGTIQDFRKPSEEPDENQPLWVPPPHITQVFIPGLGEKTADGQHIIASIALGKVSITHL